MIRIAVLFLSLQFSFGFATPLNASPAEQSQKCNSLLRQLEESTAADWGQLPPSLKPLLAWNLALLAGVEGTRGLMGWEHAFSPQFFVNTPLDATLTAIAHIIAIGRAPNWLRTLANGKAGYIARATTNTLINTAVILAFWHGTAWAQGKTISPGAIGSALGLCSVFYFCIQFVKNKLFVQFPRKFDADLLRRMKSELGSEFTRLIQNAQARGTQLEISKEDVELLFLSTLDTLIHTYSFEQRILNNKIGPEHWRIHAQAINAANSKKSKERQRRKLIWTILSDIESYPQWRADAELALALGDPLTQEQSFRIHRYLRDRYRRNRLDRKSVV